MLCSFFLIKQHNVDVAVYNKAGPLSRIRTKMSEVNELTSVERRERIINRAEELISSDKSASKV